MQTPQMRVSDPARLERKRKIRNIYREAEMKKLGISSFSPSAWRNPRFYFGVMLVLAVLGAALSGAIDKAQARKAEPPVLKAGRHVDVLAEALGRYKFHTGSFPSAQLGLAALVRNPLTVPGWNGPYVNLLRRDPWGTWYCYEPPQGTNVLPRVYSCGPDGLPGTADDILPDAERFDPGSDWTNGWVSEEERVPGVRVIYLEKEGDGNVPE